MTDIYLIPVDPWCIHVLIVILGCDSIYGILYVTNGTDVSC